jgi:hypothetical protein
MRATSLTTLALVMTLLPMPTRTLGVVAGSYDPDGVTNMQDDSSAPAPSTAGVPLTMSCALPPGPAKRGPREWAIEAAGGALDDGVEDSHYSPFMPTPVSQVSPHKWAVKSCSCPGVSLFPLRALGFLRIK